MGEGESFDSADVCLSKIEAFRIEFDSGSLYRGAFRKIAAMGITIHYRGTIGDLQRIEEFEDRVIDMALEIGASARIWRTSADTDAARMVRGLILDLSPGQETTSHYGLIRC